MCLNAVYTCKRGREKHRERAEKYKKETADE